MSHDFFRESSASESAQKVRWGNLPVMLVAPPRRPVDEVLAVGLGLDTDEIAAE